MKDYPAMAWWFIWKERSRVFEDQKKNVVDLKLKCIFLHNFWSDTAMYLELEAMVDLLSSLHTVKFSF